MPLVNIPDHLYQRLEAFAPVGRAVLNEDIDIEGVTEIIIDAGLRSALNAIIQPQEETVLVLAFDYQKEVEPKLTEACSHVDLVLTVRGCNEFAVFDTKVLQLAAGVS